MSIDLSVMSNVERGRESEGERFCEQRLMVTD